MPSFFCRSLPTVLLAAGLVGGFAVSSFAQDPKASAPSPAAPSDEIECVIDMAQAGTPLPRLFSPSIDMSGRGFYADVTWPQTVAAPAVVEAWEKDLGFKGVYRLQFNLWEISELDRNPALQDKLFLNYESVIQRISDAGGIVILDIYAMPQGQGKVLDKTSSPIDPVSFKQQIKEYIRHFSCIKKYNVWYEVWSAPDLDDFFLGSKSEYLTMYRCVAEAAKELQAETRCVIPVGGPSTSWWFRNFDGSTVLSPERSLIYELIKFCYRNKLPLDFITWHAYATDPQTELGRTAYNRNAVELIRDWLSYFGFPKETPLIVDEWNFDSGRSNVLEERQEKGNISASYVFSRLKNMYEAGLDYQVFFSLEDFLENKEGVVRNTGAFWYQPARFPYEGGTKAVYSAFRMLGSLGRNLLPVQKNPDDFCGTLATRDGNDFAVIAYAYADPDIFRSYISRTIGLLNETERLSVIALLRSGEAKAIERGEVDPAGLKLSGKTKNILKKARDLALARKAFLENGRRIRLTVKNMPSPFILQLITVDDSCVKDCSFLPAEVAGIVPGPDGSYQQVLTLKPYSCQLILFKSRPAAQPEIVQAEEKKPAPAVETAPAVTVPASAPVPATPEAAAPVEKTQNQEKKPDA